MNQLIPSLTSLLVPIASAFHPEVFPMFCQMTAAWMVCTGRRTISRVWETTGQTYERHHAAAFRLYSQAAWNWDEVMRLHLAQLLRVFIPGMRVWLVLDDTLCHKRGAKVAFGGIFLDAVLSSRKHKIFRYGNNWVLMGLIVSLPFRRDRPFCIPLLWRIFEKQGTKSKKDHRTKNALAAEMVQTLASWLPEHEILVVADSAYIGKILVRDRPKNVQYIGPICWKAALTEVTASGKKQRMPSPRAMLNDDLSWPSQIRFFDFANGTKRRLEVKTWVGCWETVAGSTPVKVLLLRDPKGEWRDEALVSTDAAVCDWEMVSGYCKRWSVEVAIADAKGMLGFHEPCVWKKESVERAAPMAWYTGMLVILWYTLHGSCHPAAKRHRPWYPKTIITFSDMLSCVRLALWQNWWSKRSDKNPGNIAPEAWLLEYLATST
jgi:DDE superfamily endonuclease